jgi:sterol desaturase/sphingolipid hydroxylase (fatty acid hydroxylase superfamily)
VIFHALLKDVLFDLLTYPVFAVLIGLEMALSWYHNLKLYTFKDTITNLSCSAAEAVVDVAMKSTGLLLLLFFNRYAVWHTENHVLYWTLLFLGQDFMYWFLHWVDHNVRLFWAVHVTHHSSEEFNLTVAVRSSVLQPLYRNIYYIPLALLGFHALDILLMYAICNTYGFFIHTKAVRKLGLLDYFMATPSNHRVHHASNVKYLDRNMGMVLVIWDQIFGTYAAEEEEPVYGLTKNVESHNIINVITYEWRNMIADLRTPGLSFRQRFMYVFGPPGWSHDGSRQTAKQMREELELQSSPPMSLNEEEPELVME